MLRAAVSGNHRRMAALIVRGVDFEDTGTAYSAMAFAAYGGHTRCVAMLLAAGAKVDAASRGGASPLSIAAELGHANCVRILLAAHFRQGGGVPELSNSLSISCNNGHHRCVALLLAANAQVDATTAGHTPIWFACNGGHAKCASRVLHAARRDGIAVDSTALLDAAAKGFVRCVKLLLRHGADARTSRCGNTAAMLAAAGNHAHCLDAILKSGAPIDAQDWRGYTALMLACAEGAVRCVRILLDRCASTTVASKAFGEVPLMFCPSAHSGGGACARALLQAGADVDARNSTGYTALILAAIEGKPDCVRALLQHNANVDATSNSGFTALGLCPPTHRGFMCARLLVAHGANVDVRDHEGCTQLWNACAFGNEAFVQLLLDAGADVNFACADHSTPLLVACAGLRTECVQKLLVAGALVNASNAGGTTPLHSVLSMPSPDSNDDARYYIAQVLRRCGARFDAYAQILVDLLTETQARPRLQKMCAWLQRTAKYTTPFHFYQDYKPKQVCQLLAAGVDLHARGSYGPTPVDLACADPDTPQSQLVLRAVAHHYPNWSAEMHPIFPTELRAHAVTLMLIGQHIVRMYNLNNAFMDVWIDTCMPHAINIHVR